MDSVLKCLILVLFMSVEIVLIEGFFSIPLKHGVYYKSSYFINFEVFGELVGLI